MGNFDDAIAMRARTQQQRYEDALSAILVATQAVRLLTEGRHRSTVLTKLDEARMWLKDGQQ